MPAAVADGDGDGDGERRDIADGVRVMVSIPVNVEGVCIDAVRLARGVGRYKPACALPLPLSLREADRCARPMPGIGREQSVD